MNKLVGSLLDWLIAVILVCLLLWFFITQPLFFNSVNKAQPEVSENNLRNHIINLKEIRLMQGSSETSQLSIEAYIFNYFSQLGKPSLQSFSIEKGAYHNVSLKLGPDTKERIVIGVRYTPSPKQLTRHMNGSGLAVILEAARFFSQNEKTLPMSVEFVAYGDSNSGESGAGSFYHAKSLSDANIPVPLMVALQSVGYTRKVDNSQSYPFSFMKLLYPDKAEFIAVSSRLIDFIELRIVKRAFIGVPDLLIQSFTAPELMNTFNGVDQGNYWSHGYSAIQVADLLPLRVEAGHNELKMNYSVMANIVKGLFEVARSESLGKKARKENDTGTIFRKFSDLLEAMKSI